MGRKKPLRTQKGRKMTGTFLVMLGLLFLLTGIAYQRSPDLAVEGLLDGGRLLWEILPVMLVAFALSGVMGKVLPKELLSRWMGEGSGITGLALGTVAGAITPGGPFVQFPIVAAFLKTGAGVGPVMAYITAWSLLGINRFLVFEAPILGWRLALIRYGTNLLFPIIIGWLAKCVWDKLSP